MTTGSGKTSTDVAQAHIVTLMYKPTTSSGENGGLSIGFDRDRDRRQRELTNNKNLKWNIHVRIMLKDVFVSAEHQRRATYSLGYI